MRNRFASLAAGLACVFGTTAAMAAGPTSTGLGQSWPNTTDVSTSPRYHVYVFQKQGVRYVQVNDASGTVRGAVAYTGADSVLDLPVGVDAGRWVTPAATATPAASTGELVYRDEAVTIRIAVQADGSARMALASSCDDPTKCSIHVAAP